MVCEVGGHLHKCRVCLREKPHEEFYRDKSKTLGHSQECKTCCKLRVSKIHYDNREHSLSIKREYYQKNIETFQRKNRRYRSQHKEELNKSCREWYQVHRDAQLDKRKKYYIENKEKIARQGREYVERNRDEVRVRAKSYRENNRGKVYAWVNKRRYGKIKRTPKWLTAHQHEQIRMFYDAAVALSKEIGIKFHVDHIIPLQGENVSGLHVPWNLQVIPAIDNLRKNNKVA